MEHGAGRPRIRRDLPPPGAIRAVAAEQPVVVGCHVRVTRSDRQAHGTLGVAQPVVAVELRLFVVDHQQLLPGREAVATRPRADRRPGHRQVGLPVEGEPVGVLVEFPLPVFEQLRKQLVVETRESVVRDQSVRNALQADDRLPAIPGIPTAWNGAAFARENESLCPLPMNKVDMIRSQDLFIDAKTDTGKFGELMPKGFKVMFAGNIGESQDFESIVKVIKIIGKKQSNIKFIIVGDGRKRAWLEEKIKINKLEDVVFLLGSFPVEDMPNFFVHADAMLLTLKPEPIFALTIPSKIQSYLAFGKPVVGMLDGIGSKIIQDAECGYVCSAGNYNELAKLVLKLYSLDQAGLTNFGINAHNYYTENFSKEKILNSLESQF